MKMILNLWGEGFVRYKKAYFKVYNLRRYYYVSSFFMNIIINYATTYIFMLIL